ncbi:hypothetical protein HI914_04660 [Erysiphe necator]|nr:hypothetical protein HI914_04660 [Erysiphe necator]
MYQLAQIQIYGPKTAACSAASKAVVQYRTETDRNYIFYERLFYLVDHLILSKSCNYLKIVSVFGDDQMHATELTSSQDYL